MYFVVLPNLMYQFPYEGKEKLSDFSGLFVRTGSWRLEANLVVHRTYTSVVHSRVWSNVRFQQVFMVYGSLF